MYQFFVFPIRIKQGRDELAQNFVDAISGPRRKEWDDLLYEFGIRTNEVYYSPSDPQIIIRFFVRPDFSEFDPRAMVLTMVKSKLDFIRWFRRELRSFRDGDLYDLQPARLVHRYDAYSGQYGC